MMALTPTHLHLFVETKAPTGAWQAEAAATFRERESLIQKGCLLRTMEEIPCPKDRLLYSMLTDGVWDSLPWSCWAKGFPEDASPELQALRETWNTEGFGDNYLTVQELMEKYIELGTDHRPEAQVLKLRLADLIYTLTATLKKATPADERRVVFWFQ
jgi:hypothetical protein